MYRQIHMQTNACRNRQNAETGIPTGIDIYTETQTNMQAQTYRDRQAYKQIDGHTYTYIHAEMDIHADKHTYIHAHTHTETDRYT